MALEIIKLTNKMCNITTAGTISFKNEWDDFNNLSQPFTLIIPEKINNIDVKSISSYAFKNCSNLECVILPNRLESINSFAFEDCKNLKAITLPDSIKWLGDSAFTNCINLEHINMPKKIDMGDNPFYNTLWLENMKKENPFVIVNNSLICVGTACGNVKVPKTVKNICDTAFINKDNITSITVQEGVIHIGSDVFEGCKNLKSIKLPESLVSIGAYSFGACSNLKEIDIPSLIMKFEEYTFAGCHDLIIKYHGSKAQLENMLKDDVNHYFKENNIKAFSTSEIDNFINNITARINIVPKFENVEQKKYAINKIDNILVNENDLNTKLALLTFRDNIEKQIANIEYNEMEI